MDFFNDALKSGRIDVSHLDSIPKEKGTLRIFSASRSLADLAYRPDQQALTSNELQAKKVIKGGLNGDNLPENVPEHNAADYEKIIANSNNAVLIIGRDRPGGKSSGYGNIGATGAGTIYLKVGMASKPESRGVEQTYADNNFKTDAAGIYISQLTDIDNNYELTKGSMSQIARSGVGIKADGIRIIGRENIKLVTGPFPKERNALNGSSITYKGIDLIAGNDDSDLQSMLLGESTTECIGSLVTMMTDLSAILVNLVEAQETFEKSLSKHTHPLSTTATGIPLKIEKDPGVASSLSVKNNSVLQNVSNKLRTWREEVGDFRKKYLFDSGETSIRSKYNRVN